MDDLVAAPLREAVARGWRGVTLACAGAASGRAALVRARPGERSDGAARVRLCPLRTAAGVPRGLALHVAGADPAPLVLDLRLAGVRALLRGLAAAGGIPVIDLGGDGYPVSMRRVDLRQASELLREVAMSAGEWSAADPGGPLARSLRWRVEAAPSVPLLAAGCRHGDPPVLVVPAGGAAPVPSLADLAAALAPGDAPCRGFLVSALRARRLTLAEVALGPEPLVTALRGLRLDRPAPLPPGARPRHDHPEEWSARIAPTQGPDRR